MVASAAVSGVIMARYSDEWKEAVNALLKGAEIRPGEAARLSDVSRAYWQEWRQLGRLPSREIAIAALRPFLRTHPQLVMACMRAGGYDIPTEWVEEVARVEAEQAEAARVQAVTEAVVKEMLRVCVSYLIRPLNINVSSAADERHARYRTYFGLGCYI
jgi:uncharacterized protein involved in cysteine biosynthesis